MSGCGDDNPDDEGREAARDNSKSVSRRADGGRGGDGDGGRRAAMLPDQGASEVMLARASSAFTRRRFG